MELVINHVSEISYIYTRRDIYQELVLFYENEADIVEMKKFSQLVRKEEQTISEMQNEEKVLIANQHFEQYKQQAEKKHGQTLKNAIIVVLVLFFLMVILFFNSKRNKEKFKEAHSGQLIQKLDQQHFLLLGLRLIAKSIDNLFHKKKQVDESLIRKQFLRLHAGFQFEIAKNIGPSIRKLRNGAKAMVHLATEGLCIIQLSRLQFSDKEVSWLLGYEDLPENHITLRRLKIRDILIEAGLANQDIQILLPC